MAKDKKRDKVNGNDKKKDIHSSKRYVRDYLALRNAIIDNCRDCIRDCGRDCLDTDAKPLENIRCPLQKVRVDYEISINKNHEFSRWKLVEKGLELE